MSRRNLVAASIVVGLAPTWGAPTEVSAGPADVGVNVVNIGGSARSVEPSCPESASSTMSRSSPDASRTREQVSNILELHRAAGDFVGARVALCDGGAIIEVTAGTTTLDPGSGPADPDVPWNIGRSPSLLSRSWCCNSPNRTLSTSTPGSTSTYPISRKASESPLANSCSTPVASVSTSINRRCATTCSDSGHRRN